MSNKTGQRNKMMRWGVIAAGLAVAAYALWLMFGGEELPEGIASGNGRLEAKEIAVSTKMAGRLDDIFVDEGDMVAAGEVVARMDTESLDAQLAEAKATLNQAIASVGAAEAQVAQRLSERASAEAALRQREAELVAARKRYERSSTLAEEGATPVQERDDDEARYKGAEAAVDAARAQLTAIDAAATTARAQVEGAKSNVEAIRATIKRIEADRADAELKAPRAGRIQYRIAEPGEVLGGGGRVLSLVNLDDVYMTFFLSEQAAGRLAMGSEARIILDAAPDIVIPATVSFVADVAQFTPKTVETKEERQKLMFRVRASVSPELLEQYADHVKTGLPGMAYVRVDPNVEWPDQFEVTLP